MVEKKAKKNTYGDEDMELDDISFWSQERGYTDEFGNKKKRRYD